MYKLYSKEKEGFYSISNGVRLQNMRLFMVISLIIISLIYFSNNCKKERK